MGNPFGCPHTSRRGCSNTSGKPHVGMSVTSPSTGAADASAFCAACQFRSGSAFPSQSSIASSVPHSGQICMSMYRESAQWLSFDGSALPQRRHLGGSPAAVSYHFLSSLHLISSSFFGKITICMSISFIFYQFQLFMQFSVRPSGYGSGLHRPLPAASAMQAGRSPRQTSHRFRQDRYPRPS